MVNARTMKRIGNTFTTNAACCRARNSPGRAFLSSHFTTTASTSTTVTSLGQPEANSKKPSLQGRRAKLGSAGITTSAKSRAAQVSIPKSNVQNVEGLGEEVSLQKVMRTYIINFAPRKE